MKVYLGADHAGFKAKESLKSFLAEWGYETEDFGNLELDKNDDYPDFVRLVAEAVSKDSDSFGILLGGSGQGEAMAANRQKGVRAAVYYGPAPKSQIDSDGNELDALVSSRRHNNANILSIGVRFLSEEEVHEAVKLWLSTAFSEEERHSRRIGKIDG